MKTNTQFILDRIDLIEDTLMLLVNQIGQSNQLIAAPIRSLMDNMRSLGSTMTEEFVAAHHGHNSNGASADELKALIRQYLSESQGGYALSPLPELIPTAGMNSPRPNVTGVYRKAGSVQARGVTLMICTVEGTLIYDVDSRQLRCISNAGDLGLVESVYRGQFSRLQITDAIHHFFAGLGRPRLHAISYEKMETQVCSIAAGLSRNDLLTAGRGGQSAIYYSGDSDAPEFGYKYKLPDGHSLQVTTLLKDNDYKISITGIEKEYWVSLPYAIQYYFLDQLQKSAIYLHDSQRLPVKMDIGGE